MTFRRVAALVRCAFVAFGLGSALPAIARAQDVLCDDVKSAKGVQKEREVRHVLFEGNETFSAVDLSARVLSTASSSLRNVPLISRLGVRRCFPDIGLANDVLNLQTFYRNYGFYDTKVDTAVVTVEPQRVDIVFRITEGLPLILDSLTITGLDSVAVRERILRDPLIKLGERVGPLLVAAQTDTIVSRLHNNGYPKATIFPAFDTHPEEHRAEVGLDVQTGVRARIGTIAVRGVGVRGDAAEIDSSVVLGLLGFRAGDVYNENALTDARRRLYDLSVYRHVDVTVDSIWARGDSVADVVIDLREDFFRQVDSDFGWGQLDCFKVNALYTDKNFQHQARRLDLTARLSKIGWADPLASDFTRGLCDGYRLKNDSLASSKPNYYLGATIHYPTLFGRPFTPAFSVYTERQGQYQAFLRTTNIGADASLSHDIARQTPLRLGYTFERGSTKAEQVVLCAIFSRCKADEFDEAQRELPLGIASVSLQRTRTDNLVDPSRGYAAGIEARYSAPFLASDTSLRFSKTTGDVALYRTLRRGIVFAARARGGIIIGGTEVNNTKLPPPQERLYAGGATTVRGFGPNQLGPQVYLLDDNGVTFCRGATLPCAPDAHLTIDSVTKAGSTDPFYVLSKGVRQTRSVPTGGNLLAVLNAEVRIRDHFFTDLLEYVPFVDAGQVWLTNIQQNVGRNGLAVTPGFGIRYSSPVGPIQISVGYNKYDAVAGPAYYTIPATGVAAQSRPLLCVTTLGAAAPVVITPTASGLSQPNDCPNTFRPPGDPGFFSHLTFAVNIGTGF
ncbi:MAG TPA: BamA/TamA family outer membrane protein [Gemmatimonadaceae bacterium]|jgi:outer membrane protein assembly factor BamA